MTDHYAEAERCLRESAVVTGLRDEQRDRLIARAAVHAQLAAIPRTTVPIIVTAPGELIDRIKVTPPAGLHGGVIFVPEEIAAEGPEGIAERIVDTLMEQVSHPLDPRDGRQP